VKSAKNSFSQSCRQDCEKVDFETILGERELRAAEFTEVNEQHSNFPFIQNRPKAAFAQSC
jgi:hypothetical protein